MDKTEEKSGVLADMEATREKAKAEATKGKGKAKKAAVVKEDTAEKAKGKGVAGWQKGLRTLRDMVNLAQLNGETIKDATIAARLSALAKAERAKVEKAETIPARLNRRFQKFCTSKG